MTERWVEHVVRTEEVARSHGFGVLRDRILELAAPLADERCVDVGAGTGLLTLPLAERAGRVWAIDISQAMCDYVGAKIVSAGLNNVTVIATSAVSLPLVDESVDLVVSNYCLHHLGDADKRRALAEILRVLRPGGRLVFADMMFRLSVRERRDRRVVASKVCMLVRKGPAGIARLGRNALRVAAGRWEKPARGQWWAAALTQAGFSDVSVVVLDHEGGIATARKP